MSSPMEILLGGNRDEATMRALSEGLRKKKDVSTLAMLSGDRTVGNFGAALDADVSQQTKQRAIEKEKEAQRGLTQGYYDQMAEQSRLSQAMARRRQDEVERHNRAMENKGSVAATRFVETQTRNLARDLTKANIPELSSGIKEIDDELAPYIEDGGELPGVGGVTNILPGFTSDARTMKSRIGKIRNIILKARSGGAVTPQEADRLLEEFALTGFNTDEEFLSSWDAFKNAFENGMATIYAGYDDAVIQQYMDNLERQTGAGVQEPSGSPGAPGTDWNSLGRGSDSSPPQEGTVNWSDLK